MWQTAIDMTTDGVGKWTTTVCPILGKSYGCQVEEKRRCRGWCRGVGFGKLAEAVPLVEGNNGIVCVHSYESATSSVVGQEEPFYEIESAGTYSAFLEFALYPKSRHLHCRIEPKPTFGKRNRFAVCSFHASAKNRIVAEIHGSKDWRCRLSVLSDYVSLREKFRSICGAIPCKVFVEIAVATVKSVKNGGIDNQFKRKTAKRECVSRQPNRTSFVHGRTCRPESDVWPANLQHCRGGAFYQREEQRRRGAQNAPRPCLSVQAST